MDASDLPAIVLPVVVTSALGWIAWLIRAGFRRLALAQARPVAAGIAYDWLTNHPTTDPKQRREDAITRAEDYLRMAVPFRLEPDRLRAEVLGGLGRLLAVDPAISISLQGDPPFWAKPQLRAPEPEPEAPEPPRPSWLARWRALFHRPPRRTLPPLPPRLTAEEAIAMGARARAADNTDTLILTADQIVPPR